MSETTIYFCGSIRGGRDDAALYQNLIEHIETHGTVLSEHVGHDDVEQEEKDRSEQEIYERDVSWLEEADIVIAEVTTPSLGVGYELAYAEKLGKPILCLYRPDSEHALSAMVRGCPTFTVTEYDDRSDAASAIDTFLETV